MSSKIKGGLGAFMPRSERLFGAQISPDIPLKKSHFDVNFPEKLNYTECI